ncbi:MAG: 4-hydroxy-tetrahydrodipicolinate reductase [Clostridia bacterium]|nr:4-hydroxy-tetrahydrodipicolinate reductase [Clostridia bacterium]
MKIILVGACGKMGAEVAKVAGEKIVCGIDLAPTALPFPVYNSIDKVKEKADVLIDFSSAKGIRERLSWCKKCGVPAVLAATGYSEEDLKAIEEFSKSVPIFKTGNFSLGIALAEYVSEKAASFLGEDFDAEIIEKHHNQKKDAPSGTALMLAESVKRGFESEKKLVYGRQGMTGAREKQEIGIHAVRGGTIVGEHEVVFAGDDEIFTISHSARSRKIFANGALRAAEWLISQPAGLYNMRDLLKELLK